MLPYWGLVQRVPVIDDLPCPWEAVVGPEAVAIGVEGAHGAEFRAVLDRVEFSPVWERSVKGAMPFCWSEGDLVLKLRSHKDTGVWSLGTRKIRWRAPGESCIVGDECAIFSGDRGIEMRAIATGEVRRTLPANVSDCESIQFMKGRLLLTTKSEYVVIDAESGREICRSHADREVRDLVPDGSRELDFVASIEAEKPGYALLHGMDGAAGLLDLRTGLLKWKRLLPLRTIPEVGCGRLTYFIGGRIAVLDEETGATLIAPTRVADTYREAVTRDGEVVVAVDENGHIVTLSIPNARVLSTQRETGAGFYSASVSGDQLFLRGNQDGTLWVYERNPSFGLKGKGAIGKTGAAERPTSTPSRPRVSAKQRKGSTGKAPARSQPRRAQR